MRALNLSVQTVPLETTGALGDEDCAKGLDLEPALPNVVHRFRQQDLPQLGPAKTFSSSTPTGRGKKFATTILKRPLAREGRLKTRCAMDSPTAWSR